MTRSEGNKSVFFFYYIAVEFGQIEVAERRIFVGRKSCERERDGLTSLDSQGYPPAAVFFHKAFVKLCPRPVQFFENIIIYILTTTVGIPKYYCCSIVIHLNHLIENIFYACFNYEYNIHISLYLA